MNPNVLPTADIAFPAIGILSKGLVILSDTFIAPEAPNPKAFALELSLPKVDIKFAAAFIDLPATSIPIDIGLLIPVPFLPLIIESAIALPLLTSSLDALKSIL